MPSSARGFSLLDAAETRWKTGYCPYQNYGIMGKPDSNNYLDNGTKYTIERVDEGALFYKNHFYGQDHQNWFGVDDNLGPVAVSLRREKVPSFLRYGGIVEGTERREFVTPRHLDEKDFRLDTYMYRIILRTGDILPLRGCILEDSIPAIAGKRMNEKMLKTSNSFDNHLLTGATNSISGGGFLPTKEVLEFVWPELQLSSLHLGVQSGPCEDRVMMLDQAYVKNTYRVGILYCKKGQQTEEDMYNNEEGGPAFNEFLDLIGQRVRLKGFEKYKAGLCTKNDSTGLYSIYTCQDEKEIMFHVSTLLPFTPNNRQQLPRKRHIGNDIVTVVFQEPGALPFIPNIKSQFQHVFIVVRVNNPCTSHTTYSVAVSRSKSVPSFGPPLPKKQPMVFPKTKAFANFLLTKIINAENAVTTSSDKFVSMATRTRQEILRDLATNYITQSTIDPGSKFNLFATKRKDKMRPRFSPDTSGLQGALSWRVVVEDCSTRSPSGACNLRGGGLMTRSVAHTSELDAFIGISSDSLVLVQDNGPKHDILFVVSTKSIIGWTIIRQSSIRIYFHQGEALILHSKDVEDREDMGEIAARLKSVSEGAPTQDFTLRRNQMGQLGFHVQHDGLVTEVENFGYAWQTGLRQGSRLVEICKQPVTSMSHEAMVDLLKTSMSVTVTVIPPHPDGQPRKGCHLSNCGYIYGALDPSILDDDELGETVTGISSMDDGDYENVPPITINSNEVPGTSQDTPNQNYIKDIPDGKSSNENTNDMNGKRSVNQFATSQRPISSKSSISHYMQPKSEATSKASVVLRRSSAYAYPSMSNNTRETATIQTHFDPISRTMSSPPRSSSSSGYGTGSSRKSQNQPSGNFTSNNHHSNQQSTSRWYDDSNTGHQNGQYIHAFQPSINERTPQHGIEITHSSSSPMSSISDGSSAAAASPATLQHSSNVSMSTPSNTMEKKISSQTQNGILSGSTKIGSGKNSAFQRVISSSHKVNNDGGLVSQGGIQVVLGDHSIGGSSGSSATNSSTSSPKISQMIYHQPPKPSRLINNNNDKKSSPPTSFKSVQVVYDSSGNTTDNRATNFSSKKSSFAEEQHSSSQSRRPLLEEKRSNDAKVTYLTEFELNQPMQSSRSSSIINVSANTREDMFESGFENTSLMHPSSTGQMTAMQTSKKVNGPHDDKRYGRDKQLLQQAIIKSASNSNSKMVNNPSTVQVSSSKSHHAPQFQAKRDLIKGNRNELQIDGNGEEKHCDQNYSYGHQTSYPETLKTSNVHDNLHRDLTENDSEGHFDDGSSCASESAIGGEFNRVSDRGAYQSYQNHPSERSVFHKNANPLKQKSSKHHLITKENLISRHEGLSGSGTQYYGYSNHKSEDELSSVSVGSAIISSEPHSSRRRRRSSRSTSSSTTISGGRQYPGSGSVTPSSLSALMTPGDSPQPPLNVSGKIHSNHLPSTQQPFLRDRSLLILGRDETILNTTRKRSSAAGERIRNHPHRNSASIAVTGTGSSKISSTLQEDLMKLIGPPNFQNGELPVRSTSTTEGPNMSNRQDMPFTQKPLRSRSKSTRVTVDDSSYANFKDSSKFNGRQKTSISINASNHHQIRSTLSKARSRENIASSHGNLSLSTNSLKTSPSSSQLYEFGYGFDSSSMEPRKKYSPSHDIDERNNDQGMSRSGIKISPTSHYERNRNSRGDSNSLSRKHLALKHSAARDNQRQKEIKKLSPAPPQGSNTLPSPPIILPVLPQEEPNFEGHIPFQKQAMPNVRDMAWTSLVDTATKVTSNVGDGMNDHTNMYIDGDSQRKTSQSALINSKKSSPLGIQNSPNAVETQVTYFTEPSEQNDLTDDENDKTIMDEVL